MNEAVIVKSSILWYGVTDAVLEVLDRLGNVVYSYVTVLHGYWV